MINVKTISTISKAVGGGWVALLIGLLLNVGLVQAQSEFTYNVNGTVIDNRYELFWQQNDDDQPRTWEEAIAYCEDLNLAGYTDWRLPDIMELNSVASTKGC